MFDEHENCPKIPHIHTELNGKKYCSIICEDFACATTSDYAFSIILANGNVSLAYVFDNPDSLLFLNHSIRKHTLLLARSIVNKGDVKL